MLDEGVDGILLETFYDIEEMDIALLQARKLSDLPVIGQFAVEDVGHTLDGYTMPEAFRIMREQVLTLSVSIAGPVRTGSCVQWKQ